MIAFLVSVLLFLVGMELIIKFLSAIYGTAIFTAIVIIIIIKASLKK